MSHRITIRDEHGAVEFDEQVDGGYSLQFADFEDDGSVRVVGKINKANFCNGYWIANHKYEQIAKKLVERFEELAHIDTSKILFLEDPDYVKKSGKRQWMARVRKAPKELVEIWGYWFIMEIRSWFIENTTDNQRVALIYHELRHCGEGLDVVKHDVEDWSNMVNALGTDWTEAISDITDIMDDGFDWDNLRQQLTLLNFDQAAKSNRGLL